MAIPQLTWDQIRPAAVVLVTGPETVLADRSMRLLRDTLKAPAELFTDVLVESY